MTRRGKGEGTVYEEPDRNRWVGAVTLDGTRRKVTGKTKSIARERLNALIAEHRNGTVIADGNITVAELLTLWFERHVLASKRQPGTVEWIDSGRRKLTSAIGSRRVRALTVEDVERFLRGTGLSHSSCIRLRSILAQALDFGIRRQLATRNVARVAEIPTGAARPPERQALTAEQARRFLDACRQEPLGPLFQLMLTAGLRPGEAAGLCWDSVDVKAATVVVRRTLTTVRGTTTLSTNLKTRGSYRTLAISEETAESLSVHRSAQLAQRLAAHSWEEHDLVFSTSTGRPLSPPNTRRALKRITIAHDLPVICPNELRHSYATLAAEAGVPLHLLADLLGHNSTRMLDAHYRHRRGRLDASVKAMSALLSVPDCPADQASGE